MLSRLPLRAQYRLGDWLGFVVRNTPNQISKQARANIELCFTGSDPAERQRLYLESVRHTCYSMTELAALWCWPIERVLALVGTTDVCPEFEASTRGRIILAPHLGSWETLVLWLGRACNAIILYKRRENRRLDEFIKQARSRSGGSPVPTQKSGLRRLLVGLKEGRSLMILPDQRPGGKKAFIESRFFGFDAPTTTLVYSLCSKVDCDVFIATMYRVDPAGGFGLRIEPLKHEHLVADESGSAQYMNDEIERRVRLYPEQYQWGYHRFKSTVFQSMP